MTRRKRKMENRKRNYTGPRWRSSAPDPIFHFLFSIFCCCALLGCAAPGEPTYRHPPVPEAIGDLAARQVGDAVVLTFTLPRNTIEHRPLAEPPAVEIFRGMIPKGPEPGKLSMRLVYTIPGALVDTYLSAGRFTFSDPLPPEELAASAGGQMVYMVRTRAAKRSEEHTSELQSQSNLVCRLLLEKKKKKERSQSQSDGAAKLNNTLLTLMFS